MQTEEIRPAVITDRTATTFMPSAAWSMLFSRSAAFLAFQAVLALLLTVAGVSSAWNEAARWWVFAVIATNILSVYLLTRVFRSEGKRYLDAIRFHRATLKTDLIWFFASGIIGLPIAAAPMNIAGVAIFGDRMAPVYQMFQPLPMWALALGLLFPLTIGFAELPTYFGYCMPRIAILLKNGWLAWLIASFFLAAQHMFLPFFWDGRYLVWRFVMYLPFALFTGLLLKWRPTLLPYFMVVHALVDISTLSVYLMI